MNPEHTNFTEALAALYAGKCVTRETMPGGSFIFRQVPSTIGLDIIPKMTSLPEEARTLFLCRNLPIHYDNQFALVDGNNNISGWTPLPTDIGANDWRILNLEGPRRVNKAGKPI